jgi:hypothetical protein
MTAFESWQTTARLYSTYFVHASMRASDNEHDGQGILDENRISV